MTDNYPPAHWRPSPNYSVRQRTISQVIIHDTEGEYEPSIIYLEKPSTAASAHYIFRSADGDVSQMVHEADIAWHSGDWDYNVRSIGIEHEGFAAHPAWYTDAMLHSSAKLTATLCQRYAIPIDRQHIIGHSEVRNADGTFGGVDHHTDPGPGWPWDRYIQLVQAALAAPAIPTAPGGPPAANWIPISPPIGWQSLTFDGYPIALPFHTKLEDGNTYLVQPFERAWFALGSDGKVNRPRIGAALFDRWMKG